MDPVLRCGKREVSIFQTLRIDHVSSRRCRYLTRSIAVRMDCVPRILCPPLLRSRCKQRTIPSFRRLCVGPHRNILRGQIGVKERMPLLQASTTRAWALTKYIRVESRTTAVERTCIFIFTFCKNALSLGLPLVICLTREIILQ